MLKRDIPPPYVEIEEIHIPALETLQLDNGLRLHLINVPGTDILRIEFLFDAGSWFQEKKLISSSVGSMLLEGTPNKSEKEIAEIVDYYGAFIDVGTDYDHSWLVLYTLNKYLPQTLEIVQDVLSNTFFPEKNLSTYLTKRKQSFIIESQKVKNIAKIKFSEALFGDKHPYGIPLLEKDFNQVTRNDLISFFRQFYHPSRCMVFVSGAINTSFTGIFSDYFGKDNWGKDKLAKIPNFTIKTNDQKIHFIKKEDAIQSAIRIGCQVVNKNHPDFIPLQVLNTILGGYFGSRLMKNIREEKGYTYGIGSAIVHFKNASFFIIASEVGNEYCKDTVNQVYNEIERLRVDNIPEEEMILVKNFMLGELMRSADGPFHVVEIWKTIIELNLNGDYLQKVIQEIKGIESNQLKLLTEKYLIKDKLIEVVAGN